MSDQSEKARIDYEAGMKYKDIAAKYDVTLNTVKSWKTRHKWSRDGVHTKEERVHTKRGGQPGNQNAKGNRGGAAPKENSNALKHGFFSKFLPAETLEIMEGMAGLSATDLIWNQIKIQYAAIIRAQQIMFVVDQGDLTKELKRTKEGWSDSGSSSEEEYELQFAWDKHATFLNAQSRAMGELRSLIKQFDTLAHIEDERRLNLGIMQQQLKKLERENTADNKTEDKLKDYFKALGGAFSGSES